MTRKLELCEDSYIGDKLMPSKMTVSDKEEVLKAIDGVCRALRSDLYLFVSEWGCFQQGDLSITLALLDSRDRDNLLRSFGRYLMERKVEFASND